MLADEDFDDAMDVPPTDSGSWVLSLGGKAFKLKRAMDVVSGSIKQA